MKEDRRSNNMNNSQGIWLPPGFRFHPTDDELITFYLMKKVVNSKFCAHAIAEIDLNKYEPWDLPDKANMGEKEWYFFSLRDRKYPTGMRTNRATEAGYWKATGKDRDIKAASHLVGMKKTLVFYRGRAPRGEKTNWVMHEYRLDGKAGYLYGSTGHKEEWVVCRIFQKRGLIGKKLVEDGHDSDGGSVSVAEFKHEFKAEPQQQQQQQQQQRPSYELDHGVMEAGNMMNCFNWNSASMVSSYSGAELAKLLEPELLPPLKVNNPFTSSSSKLKTCKSEPYVVDANILRMDSLGDCLSYETHQHQQQQHGHHQQVQLGNITHQDGLNELIFSRFLADPPPLELDQLYAF